MSSQGYRSVRIVAAAAAIAGGTALASAAQDPERMRIRPKVTLQAAAGQLEVREGSGDVALWRIERVVNAPEVFEFRWKTQRDDVTSATWRVALGSPDGSPLATGPAGLAPSPGSARYFYADLRSVLGQKPPSTPRVYWVLLDVGREGGGTLRSTPVKLTYVRPPNYETKFTDEGLDQPLEPIVESVRSSFGLPAMGGAVVRKNGWMKIGVSGVRRHDYPTRVFPNDRWHLGSLTKAMTATLAAILVDRKFIAWNTTLGDAFPELHGEMNTVFRDITLLDLLQHFGGMPASLSGEAIEALQEEDESNATRRYLLTKVLTNDLPAHNPNRWVYSNAGYMVAAAMLEKRTGRTWEDMMRTDLFGPLGMHLSGFGPPEWELVNTAPVMPILPRQPWGHRPNMEVWDGGRAPAAAPAGDVHASLSDYARFILLHLNGSHGNLQLSPMSLSVLHTARSGRDLNGNMVTYAPGWGRSSPDDGTMAHDGCNTWWYARAVVDIVRGYGLIVTTNLGDADPDGDGPLSACRAPVKAVGALTARLTAYMGY